MFKIEIQSVVIRPVHDRQIHGLSGCSVGIPFRLIFDVSQLLQPLLLQSHGLIGQRHGLIGLSVRMGIFPSSVCEIGHRIIVRMPEIFILQVADLMDSLKECLILRNDGPKREGMDPGTAGFLLF